MAILICSWTMSTPNCRFGGAHERYRGVKRVSAEDSGDAVHHNIADHPAANRRCHPQRDCWKPVQSQGKGFDGAYSRRSKEKT